MNSKAFYTVAEFAELIHATPENVRKACAAGEIPARKVLRRWIISAEQVQEQIRADTRSRGGGE